MHYRKMYDDSDMLYAYDLDGVKTDVVVVIEKAFAGELVGQKGRKTKKPFIKIRGREKKLALNKTNGKAISRMYGNDTDQWAGKPIALYVTQVEFEGEMRDAIRVRPQPPEMPRGRGGGGGSSGARRGDRSEPALQGQIREHMEAAGASPDRDGEQHEDDGSPGASHE